MTQFYNCQICGYFHAIEWNGDCRDNDSRFTCEELDEKYGALEWEEVAMPTWEDA